MTMTLHLAHWPSDVPRNLDLPDQTLYQNLLVTARRVPDHPAIHYYGTTLTYAQLLAAVDNLAGYLQAKLGVAKGDRVLLYMQNSPQFVIGYFAILRADAVVVPVNPMSKATEMRHLVEDTGASAALVGQELLPQITPLTGTGNLKGIVAATYAEMTDAEWDIALPAELATLSSSSIDAPGVCPWAEALDAGIQPAPTTAGLDDIAVIPYSSGTTGLPKGCVHTNRTVQATAFGSVLWNPIDENDTHLVSLPLFHVTGMQSSMNGPIISGGAMIIMTRWDRRIAARLIERFRITRWRSIATMVIDLLNDAALSDFDLSSLKGLGGGGAAMPAAVAKRLREVCGEDYIEGYGMSETIAGTHINPVDAPKRQCLGIPVFEVDSRVVDVETRRQCGPGEVGEIIINAPQVFKGYWRRPEETEAAFLTLDGKRFLLTGDIGYYDDDGYFFMVDRAKRMINVAGFKVWPAEVEALMHRNAQIAEVCVIATPDARRGEAVKALVVPRSEPTPSEAEIIAWCRAEMATYKCPTKVSFVDNLPKSGTGKVNWRLLTEREREGRDRHELNSDGH